MKDTTPMIVHQDKLESLQCMHTISYPNCYQKTDNVERRFIESFYFAQTLRDFLMTTVCKSARLHNSTVKFLIFDYICLPSKYLAIFNRADVKFY